MKKNILNIIESSETGGAESVFHDLVSRVDHDLYTPHVALLQEGWLFDQFVHDGVRPRLILPGTGGFDLRLITGIYRLAQSCNIHLIHSHLFTTNVYASVVGSLLRIPVITTFHGTMDVSEHDRFARLKWWALNTCAKEIVFVSHYLKDYFVAGNLACSSKARVIYNGIDIEKFQPNTSAHGENRQAVGVNEESFVVVAVGDLRPAKDYETAIRSIALLKDRIPGLVLLIAGTRTELYPRLEELCAELHVSGHIRFLGFRPDVCSILKVCDVYLTSSVSEGFSLTLVEAMASKIPVIATRCGGPEEIVTSGQTGLLVEKGNPGEIASAIEFIFKNRAAASALAADAAADVRQKFSLLRMVNEYQSLYRELTG